MNNYLKKICQLTGLICIIAFVGGCSDQSAPVEARVVRKKIVAKRPAEASRKKAPVKIAKTAAVFTPKSDIARGAPPQPATAEGKDAPDSQTTRTSALKSVP